MTTPAAAPPPLSDSVLSKLHLAEFAAGFFSPATKELLLKAEPLLPSLQQHGLELEAAALAVWKDIKELAPAFEPALRSLIAKAASGVPREQAVADVRSDAQAAHGAVDRQAFTG
jgi:hypothetical protein